MSHTNATANYELSQFLGSDKPAWLTDYNGDMLKIDTALNNNADAIANNAQDIDNIETAIGAEGLDGRLTTAENDINNIESLLGDTALPTTAQSITGAIAELKSVNDNQTRAIGDNANEIQRVAGSIESVAQVAYTIAEVYDSTDTYAVGDYVIYQGTLYKCTTAINVGESFDPFKWTSVKVMDEVGQGGGGTPTAAQIDYDNSTSHLNATKVQSAIDELAAAIPSAVAEERQSATLTAGQTSLTLTFADQPIGATTFIDWYVSDPEVSPTAIATTGTTVAFTFEAQASNLTVGAIVRN